MYIWQTEKVVSFGA